MWRVADELGQVSSSLEGAEVDRDPWRKARGQGEASILANSGERGLRVLLMFILYLF